MRKSRVLLLDDQIYYIHSYQSYRFEQKLVDEKSCSHTQAHNIMRSHTLIFKSTGTTIPIDMPSEMINRGISDQTIMTRCQFNNRYLMIGSQLYIRPSKTERKMMKLNQMTRALVIEPNIIPESKSNNPVIPSPKKGLPSMEGFFGGSANQKAVIGSKNSAFASPSLLRSGYSSE